MNSRFLLPILTALLLLPAAAFSTPYSENFASPVKADGSIPGWTFPSKDFTVDSGALVSTGSNARSFAVWTAVPMGKTVTYTATVTLLEVPGASWDVAGIGIYTDDKNYWHLAFVQMPTEMKSGRFAELSEAYLGGWNVQSSPENKLEGFGEAMGINWKTGVPYQFKIVMGNNQIDGQILEGTVVKFHKGFKFTANAVTKGRPMIDAAGTKARFTDLKVDVSDTAN